MIIDLPSSRTWNILNLFDEANVLARFETIGTTGLTAPQLGITAVGSLEQESAYQRQATNTTGIAFLRANNLIDPRYNLPNLFQGPRSVRFGFKFQF